LSQQSAAGDNHTTGNTRFEFVFGGTFDPVHLGHQAILSALRALSPSLPIRLIPCAIPPLKAQPHCQFEQRVAMLKLVTDNITEVILDTQEKLRDKPSYTVETLENLAQEYPCHGFILVMGMDSMASLRDWHEWQRLSQLCHLLIINRPGTNEMKVKHLSAAAGFNRVSSFKALTTSDQGNAFWLNMAEMSHSSTQIREAINKGEPLDSLLSQSVIEYIGKNHLYKE